MAADMTDETIAQYMERCFWRTELRTCENKRRRDNYFEPAKRNLHDCHS